MAFTVTEIYRGVLGAKKYVYGKYVNDSGSTGGDINTGLSRVECFMLTEKDTAVMAAAAVVNETLPLDSANVTIVTTADKTGYYLAIGE